MSYANLILYSNVIPSYKSSIDKEKKENNKKITPKDFFSIMKESKKNI